MSRVHASAIFLLTPLLATAAFGQVVKVEVQADTVYEINGVDQIQSAVFGVTAYEGAPWPAQEQWRDVIADSGIACLGFPRSGMSTPDKAPESIADIVAWYDSDAAASDMTDGNLNGSRHLYGQILPACRQLGIEPMMYVFGTPRPRDTGTPHREIRFPISLSARSPADVTAPPRPCRRRRFRPRRP